MSCRLVLSTEWKPRLTLAKPIEGAKKSFDLIAGGGQASAPDTGHQAWELFLCEGDPALNSPLDCAHFESSQSACDGACVGGLKDPFYDCLAFAHIGGGGNMGLQPSSHPLLMMESTQQMRDAFQGREDRLIGGESISDDHPRKLLGSAQLRHNPGDRPMRQIGSPGAFGRLAIRCQHRSRQTNRTTGLRRATGSRETIIA